MPKKGYFFIIDSIVALTALTVGVMLIFSIYESSPKTEQTYQVAKEVIDTLQDNRIRNLNNEYAGPNSILTRNGNITDTDKTLMEQVGEFYYRNQTKGCGFCMGLITDFLDNTTENLIPPEFSYTLLIDNITVYDHSTTEKGLSSYVTPARWIVHGLYNNSEMYGPYVVEAISWG